MKLNPRHQASLPSLQRRNEELRRSVRDTIRAAEEHLVHSEVIVSQSALILDRARETLESVASAQEQRQHDAGQGRQRRK